MISKHYMSFFKETMTSYYVVLQDMNYDNNHILFISLSEDIAMNWYKANTNPQKDQISVVRYDMSDEGMLSETTLV